MYRAIAKNKRNTVFIILIFLGIIGGLGYLASAIYNNTTIVIVTVVVTKNDSGELVVTSVTYGSVTATEDIEDATATVVNTIETTEFEFNKKWFGDALSTTAIGWPTGVASIEVTIGRRLKYQADAVTVDETTAWTNPDDGFSKVYMLTQTTGMGAGLPDLTVTSANNVYKYVLKGLDKYGVFEGHQGEWEYFVSEARQNAYTTVFKDENDERLDGATSARNGGTIENRLITVSLPATGGRGTTTIYIAGAALVLQAILGFILRRKVRKEID
jgi:LPXTG-motif cell wall-anchored protein